MVRGEWGGRATAPCPCAVSLNPPLFSGGQCCSWLMCIFPDLSRLELDPSAVIHIRAVQKWGYFRIIFSDLISRLGMSGVPSLNDFIMQTTTLVQGMDTDAAPSRCPELSQ